MPFVPGICWRVGCISGGRAERQHTPSVGIRGQYLGGPELVKRFFPSFGDLGTPLDVAPGSLVLESVLSLSPGSQQITGRLCHLSKSQWSLSIKGRRIE